MTTNNPLSLRSILEKDKLKDNGTNFLDWSRNLRIVLKQERKLYVLDEPLPEEPAAGATRAERDAYKKHKDDSVDVGCLMLATMAPELQKHLEHMEAFELGNHLRETYQQHAQQERFDTTAALWTCRMAEGSSVSAHVLKMKGYIDHLERLGCPIPLSFATDIILKSLDSNYTQFIMNFMMNKMEKPLSELHAMLKTAEQTIRKASPGKVLLVTGENKKRKRKGKGKGKGKGEANVAKKPKHNEPKPKEPKEEACFHCNEKGHWRRNCPAYLAANPKKKSGDSSGIYVIDINISTSATWVFDTGCGSHICTNVQELKRSRKLRSGEVTLRVGNGARVAALAVGIYELMLPSGLLLCLNNCYYVPALCQNIISVWVLDKEGYKFLIGNGQLSLYNNNEYYCTANAFAGIYVLNLTPSDGDIYNINTIVNDQNPTYVWHCRLGHINKKRMSKLHQDGLLDSYDCESFEKCESCLLGKMTKQPFTGKGTRATDLLGLVHSDVCGPMRTQARGGYSYFVTFTDDFSRYGYVYLMKHKHETFEMFKRFQSEVQNQLGKTIKVLRSDRGGEYLSQEFDDHLKSCGIISQLTPPGTPQMNGVSERRNRTLLDMVRSMMSHADLPISFWGYALLTAAMILNRVPSKAVEKTPYQIWTGKVPNLSFLKVWGCDAYVKRLISDKLEAKSDKCKFVGYPEETKGYYFYSPTENKVFVARFGVFLEKEFISKRNSGSLIELDENREPQIDIEPQEEVQQVPEPVQEPVASTVVPRRSGRTRHEPERYGFLVSECGDVMLVENDEPTTYAEAVNGPDSEKWQEAMELEMQSMYDNQVWTLVDLPEGARPIGNKWVFKKKTNVDGIVNVHRSRLVAKGFKQIQGIDYDETFSPVAMIKSVRILLAIAAYYDYEIWQMDVKTAFLNGKLQEDVYMTQPEGFVSKEYPDRVCKLQRSIYGLKQASRSWNLRFDEAVKEFGFIKNEDEPCVYMKFSGSTVVFLVLYVDDILIMGNDIPVLQTVKTWLSSCFSMKDLGEASYILGIRIYRDRSKRLIGLSQSTYIDKVLKRFKMEESKKGSLPMSSGVHLSKKHCPQTNAERENMSKVPYASAIGSIMYAMICTRPDVSYALSVTSKYQSDPGEKHWIAVKNILKYLRRTKEMFLVYGGMESDLIVKGYTDASFQTDIDDLRSQSGYVFVLN